MKILVLSTPKTGNKWLVNILSNIYRIPIVDIPFDFSIDYFNSLPFSFIGHQHMVPSAELIDWINNNEVHVFSTIRHPLDTLISYIKYVEALNKEDFDGVYSMYNAGDIKSYIEHKFYNFYRLSLDWQKLGSVIVRYEDLYSKPIEVAKCITYTVKTVTSLEITEALLLSTPQLAATSGKLPDSHISELRLSGRIIHRSELISEFKIPFWEKIISQLGYDFDLETKIKKFDLEAIDVFSKKFAFDNGVRFTNYLKFIYYRQAGMSKWPSPEKTSGDSFWCYLTNTDFGFFAETADCDELEEKHKIFTGFITFIYNNRPDLWLAFPDPLNENYEDFLGWLYKSAPIEYLVPASFFEVAHDLFLTKKLPKLHKFRKFI